MTDNLPAIIPKCPVCGTRTDIASGVTFCERCDTPQHTDCTEYNRGCGIYSCEASKDHGAQEYKPQHMTSRRIADAITYLAKYMVQQGNEMAQQIGKPSETRYQTAKNIGIAITSLSFLIASVPMALLGMITSIYATVSEADQRKYIGDSNSRRQTRLSKKKLDSAESQSLIQISSRYDSNPTPSNYNPSKQNNTAQIEARIDPPLEQVISERFSTIDHALEQLITKRFSTSRSSAIDDELDDREKEGHFKNY